MSAPIAEKCAVRARKLHNFLCDEDLMVCGAGECANNVEHIRRELQAVADETLERAAVYAKRALRECICEPGSGPHFHANAIPDGIRALKPAP